MCNQGEICVEEDRKATCKITKECREITCDEPNETVHVKEKCLSYSETSCRYAEFWPLNSNCDDKTNLNSNNIVDWCNLNPRNIRIDVTLKIDENFPLSTINPNSDYYLVLGYFTLDRDSFLTLDANGTEVGTTRRYRAVRQDLGMIFAGRIEKEIKRTFNINEPQIICRANNKIPIIYLYENVEHWRDKIISVAKGNFSDCENFPNDRRPLEITLELKK